MTPAIAEFTMYDWSIANFGGSIDIDPYDCMPTGTVAVVDVETDEKDNIVCIGICEDGETVKVFFDIRPELIAYLRQVQIVGHGCKSSEIKWLERYGVTIDQLYHDTMICEYVYDSTQKSYGLKKILEDKFGVVYPTYSEMVSNEEVIKDWCDCHDDLIPKNKKGLAKPPKRLTLDKLPPEYVAQYNAADCFYTHKLYTWQRQNMSVAQLNFFNTIELPMTKLIYEMERKGVKIDTKFIRRLHNEKSKERRKARKKLFEIAGKTFNPNSPKQVLPILNSLGAETTTTGEDDIKRFSDIPFVEALLQYRGLQKILSTYTIPLYFNAIKESDRRIHARFNQATITGRLSSSDPINLQNQPPIVRSAFYADSGNVLIGSDWTNVELYLPANFSGEPKFIDILGRPDGDLHRATAEFLFGTTFSGATEVDKRLLRQKAKTCNFLLTNSGAPYGLSKELQCSEAEAQEIYKKYWETYSVMAAWLKEEKRKARVRGGVTTMFGRYVPLPGLKSWCGTQDCPVFDRERHYYCKPCGFREATERQAISVLVQGSASDLVKLSALRLKQEYGLVPIISCHDELVYEVPEAQAEEASRQIKLVMENTGTFKLPLKANVKIGKNWSEAH